MAKATTDARSTKNEETETKDELATHPTTALATNDVPDYLKEYEGRHDGTEEVEREDVTLPRLGLCQSMTPQRKRSEPTFIEGLEEGQFFNTVSSTTYGKWVEVVPLFFYKSRIKFNPIDTGGGIDCQSLNGKTGGRHSPEDCSKCEFSQFKDGNTPECDDIKNFVSLVISSDKLGAQPAELIVVSMKSTALKVAKRWNALIRMTNKPMFARSYKISSSHQKKSAYEWEQFVVDPQGWVNREFFLKAEETFKGLRDQDIKADTTGLDEGESFNTQQM